MRTITRAALALALLVPTVVVAGVLEVTHDGVGTSVEKHVLKGRAESFPAGSTVFYWTRIIGGRPGDRIRHVWIHDGREISVGLAIGGHHWRTYSSKRLDPTYVGEWVVEARDPSGEVLSRRKFTSTAE